jgi:hypothetical protein
MIATPLRRGGGPLYPICCPICDKLLGSFYRDGLSLKANAALCTDQCVTLWATGRGLRDWRDLSPEWRKLDLAARRLEHAVRQNRAP